MLPCRHGRALGSTDYHTRDKGLQALTRFLTHKNTMKAGDMLKLWKGLFYCFWHSDKVPVQVCACVCVCAEGLHACILPVKHNLTTSLLCYRCRRR